MAVLNSHFMTVTASILDRLAEPVPANRTRYRLAGWAIFPEQNRLARAGKEVVLEPKLMDLLCCLARARGETVSRAKIFEQVWTGVSVSGDSLYRAVSQLRRALSQEDSLASLIVTVPRRGYRLEGIEVVRESASLFSGDSKSADKAPGSRRVGLSAFGKLAKPAVAIAIALLGVSQINLSTSQPGGQAQASVHRADALYFRHRQADNEDAISLYTQAIELAPDTVDAWAGLASAFAQRYHKWSRKASDLNSAINAARTATALAPNSAEAHKSLGLAFEYAGRPALALDSYLAALEAEPDSWTAMSNIGDLHRNQGEFGLARHWYRRALGVGGDRIWIETKLGKTAIQLGRYDEAAEHFGGVLSNEPLHSSATLGLARVHYYTGDTDAALRICEDYLARRPDDLNCGIFRGEMFLRQGRPAEAQDAFQAPRRTAERKWIPYLEFRVAQAAAMGSPNGREELLRFVEADFPADGSAVRLWSLAAAQALLGNLDEAGSLLEQARSKGWRDFRHDRQEPAFAVLRSHPEFSHLFSL